MARRESAGRLRLTTDETLLRYALQLIRGGRFRAGSVGLQMLWDRQRTTGTVAENLGLLQERVLEILQSLGDAPGARERVNDQGANHDGTTRVDR